MKNMSSRKFILFFFVTILTINFTDCQIACAMMKRGAGAVEGAVEGREGSAPSLPPRKRQTFEARSPLYNTTFRLAFLQPRCMIDFLNSIYDFEGEGRIKEIQYLNQEFPAYDPDRSSVLFDLHCRTVKGETFLVEIQKAFIEGLATRLESCSATALRHQWEGGSASGSKDAADQKPYWKLEPVRTLALFDCPDKIFERNPGGYIHTYKILNTRTQSNDLPLQQWTLVDLCGLRKKINAGEDVTDVSERLKKWLHFLIHEDSKKIEVEGEDTDPLVMAYRAVSVFTREERWKLEAEEHTIATHFGMLEGAKKLAEEQARKEAEKRGEKKGRERGRWKTLLDLLDAGTLTEAQFKDASGGKTPGEVRESL